MDGQATEKDIVEKLTELWLETVTDEQAIIVAERILVDYFDNPRAVKLYPVVYRERVTHQERDQLTMLLSTIRVSDNEFDITDIMKVIPLLGLRVCCPNCGLIVKGLLEHYNAGEGEWKCPLKQTKSKSE